MIRKEVLIYAEFFEPAFKAGGPVQSLKNLAKNLCSDFNITVLAHANDIDGTFLNVPVNRFVDSNGYKIFYSSFDFSISRFFKENKFDIVYINSFFTAKANLIILYFSRKYKFDIILAPRGQFLPGALVHNSILKHLYIFIFKLLFVNKIKKFHATSLEEAISIRNVLKTPEDQIYVANNIKDVQVKSEYFEESSKTPDQLKLVFFSRITPKKNLDFALKCLRNTNGSRITLDIFGTKEDITYWDNCLTIIETMPPHVIVNYKGILKQNEVLDALNRYDALFFPTKGENFGHVILEALMAGLPIILSDETPFSDIDGICGWVFPLNRHMEFTNCINRIARFNSLEFSKYKRNIPSYLIRYKNLQLDVIDNYSKIFN